MCYAELAHGVQVPVGFVMSLKQTPTKLAYMMNVLSKKDSNKELIAGDLCQTAE